MNSRLNFFLTAAAGIAIAIAAAVGSTSMPVERFLAALFGVGDPGDMIVVWEIRAPRALAAFIVGAALGASGAALQGLLRNPLAEPGILGVSASAALGASLVLFYAGAAAPTIAVPLAAIAGALAATALLTIAAIRVGSVITLILIGVGLSSFAGAVSALLLNLAPNPFSLADLLNWTLGTVANRSFDDIALAAPFLIAGFVFLGFSARPLSALGLGEETAFSLGVDLKRTRILVVLGAGLATGAAVALAGAIGFVGIVAPHLIRPLVRHDPSRTLIPSALAGGIILVLADIGVRILPTPTELRLGVVAALIGAPIFVWIAAKRNARS